MATGSVADELLRVVQSYDHGMTDDEVKLYFKTRYISLAPVINSLMQQNKLKVFTLNGVFVYKAVHEVVSAKFEGMAPGQILVYQVCERAGDK